MLDAAKLATFRSVVEHGSLSAAGRARSLTQPAVSRQVAVLEAQLGTALLRRTRRGVQPTEAGRLLAAHAAEIERRLARAEDEVAGLGGRVGGEVRMGSFFTAFAQLTPELEARAERALPGVTFAFFFFNDTATTEIYTLSLHDALPICLGCIPTKAWVQTAFAIKEADE